ncbi:carbohydrate ABC transporter permease [Motilibacter deserti]|uniref:Carbohydrate ABC transporter permease n=1 Tax=Motilibacter deserti TaxID=2714956 RepID=A0ABX0GU61_9ACTN|nr:carbohydrate ABC transporter permease [Motilibacter deserti]NHC12843.1 carbohydrate ABC transporter permease [Motilibacter deserti]
MALHIDETVAAEAGAGHADPPRGPQRRRRGTLRTWVEIVALAAIAVVMLFPVVWMLETSLKEGRDVYAVPAKILSFDVTLDHYKDVFVQRDGSGTSDLAVSFKNSIIVAGTSTLLATLLGVPAAWAYSRFRMKAKKDQLFFILSTRFMPPVVVVIPIFLMYRDLGLLNTKLGLILIYAAFNLPFTIWMMKGFVDEVPAEYEEAAMLDGYSRFEAFWRYTLPLLVPGIAATAVFALIFSWNEFVFAIFLTSSDSVRTAPPAIAGLIGGTTIDWGLVAASAMVFAAPVLLFAFLVRKHLVAGVTLGAVRR